MSAKLPVMSYDVLSTMSGVIGYATTIQHSPIGSTDHVSIFHHGHLIAEVWRGGVWLSNAGYNTSTTSQRLNRILTDNLPGTPYRVGLRDRVTSLVHTDKLNKPITPVGRGIIVYDNGDVYADNINSVVLIAEKAVA